MSANANERETGASKPRPAEEVKVKIAKLCDSIRAKTSWYSNILDKERNLASTWAREAGFLEDPDPASEENVAVRDAIEELKSEARRILFYDHSVHLGSPQVPRPVDFNAIDVDVLKTLKYLRGARYAMTKPDLRQDIGAFVSDNVVPESLHRELVAELDALAAMGPKDFHPNTYGKVQNLIHPSTYPFIAGITDTHKPAALTRNERFRTRMSTHREPPLEVDVESIYSWIPSVFEFSGLDVHIASYVNGLGPRERHPVLYRLIEKLFLLILPQLERTAEHEFDVVHSKSVQRWYERPRVRKWHHEITEHEWRALLESQALQKAADQVEDAKRRQDEEIAAQSERADMARFYGMEDSELATPYGEQRLKVIVKAVNYVLKPGQTYEGAWHIEGLPHEQIIATAIYYYDTDVEIEDEGLSFRYLRDPWKDFPSSHRITGLGFHDFLVDFNNDDDVVLDYPSDWEESVDDDGNPMPMSLYDLHQYIPLGTIPTANFSPHRSNDHGSATTNRGTGRIITFPNWVQHKVTSLKNGSSSTDPDAPAAQRKMLCFFLLGFDNLHYDKVSYHGFSYRGLRGLAVLTTADVPLQGRCNERTLHVLLSKACFKLTGKSFPMELVMHIENWVPLGLSREMAEHHRRQSTRERATPPPTTLRARLTYSIRH